MENSSENCNVKVALHIRPLSRLERQNGGKECLDVVPGTAKVLIDKNSFIFDHIYGGGGSPSINMFEECVMPLLDALFQGYNSTVIAYGQTGSGKTYTMGTNPKETSHKGLIFQIMQTIFNKMETLKNESEFQLHVSFIEILKEEVRDLLDSAVIERIETSDGNPESVAPGKPPVQVRKAADGAQSLNGSTEVSVSTQKEMTACLEQGCLKRSVASTDMNTQSSRSHAIFTIILEQKDKNKGEENPIDCMGEEYRCAKLHLVDLAGSERAKKSATEGVRFKEGVHINKGLFALGNVISALGDDKKRKEAQHIPYRDSKLTRLLQASLGGNCKTVMIACVSPADFNFEETLNTLKYANRARNIQNKASVQTEVFPVDTHKLRQQYRLLQEELAHMREAEIVEVQDLKRKIDWLENTNTELLEKIIEMKDLKRKIERLEATNSDLLQKINEYRNKCAVVGHSETDAREDKRGSRYIKSPEAITEPVTSDDISSKKLKEPDKKTIEPEHEIQQNMMHQESNNLDKPLEQKEIPTCLQSEMKLGSDDMEELEQRFGKKITALEEEKRLLQLERDDLQAEITHLESMSEPTSNEQTMNTEKLEAMEEKISELERKHEAQVDVLRQKSHDAMKRLQDEISLIKKQKVQLQQKVKEEEEQFRKWKASQEKQMMQIKKESRKTEIERHKLQALYQRQTQVLQRKTEEAARATKKLKELLELRKAARRSETAASKPSGQNRSGQIKALKKWLHLELDKVMKVYKLRIDHEKKTQSNAKLKEELSLLKQMDKPSSHVPKPSASAEETKPARGRSLSPNAKAARARSLSPNAKAARIVSLESRVKSCTASLAIITSKIQEAGRGHDVASPGRWKGLVSLGDAKDLLQYLFSIVIDARRRLWEKEIDLKETKSQFEELLSQQNNNKCDPSSQTTAIQPAKLSSLTKKWKEMEEQAVQNTPVQNTRDKTPTRKSRETEKQPATSASLPPLKGKAPTTLDIFADMGIGPPLPFPESKESDSNAGICNRPVKVLYKQTEKMIPIAHTSMKKAPLEEQKGKVSRWRRGHDEWLIQFKWKWQKPWKLGELFGSTDQIRNSDETLKGQDLSTRLGQTT
ncbi:unnamed protein product [Lactuca saligna]|uniref:Kinesin motor domain-containing protein n=1 Tax=Lactuca saligna TaxID=75948 RepID=A0AA35YZQ9_LACSI|nr:unnamed protein product [Lactuca saligna]